MHRWLSTRKFPKGFVEADNKAFVERMLDTYSSGGQKPDSFARQL